MGVEWPYDPDDSYELTTDNLKKILAIHMRFRLDDLFASLLVLVKLAKWRLGFEKEKEKSREVFP